MRSPDLREVEALYRAVADGEPRREILQMIYDMFGDAGYLRPPVAEMRLADHCRTERSAARG
jgi:hypothetical protein